MNLEEFLGLDENEKPLDRIVTDGGMCGIFRTIGCIGDSLSSGEFETIDDDLKKHYHDFYEYSWGQYISRSCGNKVINMSRGGMTAFKYRMHFADENGFWNDEYKLQSYIIALGVNDSSFYVDKIGDFDYDVNLDNYEENAHTFIGDYTYIIQRLKNMQPDAKIFLVTMPLSRLKKDGRKDYSQAIRDIAAHFDNIYVIDLEKYGFNIDDEFKKRYFLGGHMNPSGYILIARIIESYIDYIVRHNPDDFKKVALIGTPFDKGADKV